MWAGLIAAEFIMEAVCREGAMARAAAVVHFWFDLCLEIPLMVCVLVTGGVLFSRTWPPSTLHWVKLALAVFAIACNVYCVGVVVRRRGRLEDPGELARGRLRVFASGVGVPFGLAALYLGLRYF